MNFFAHARITERFDADPRVVLGAMLPDFEAMVRLRATVDDAHVARGIDWHVATDAAFHGCEAFRRACASASAHFEAVGVGHGPARAVGHIGYELLLDGWLAMRATDPRPYADAIALGHRLASALAPAAPDGASRFRTLFERLAGWIPPRDYDDPDFVLERLATILERRPRLRFTPDEAPRVRTWLAKTREGLARGGAEAAIEETHARLARARREAAP